MQDDWPYRARMWRGLENRFQLHPEFKRAYWLRTDEGETAVTFDSALFDAHPSTQQLLTYGSELLAALVEAVPEPAPAEPSVWR